MHSPIEVASYKDVESMIEILSEFLVSIDSSLDLSLF
jgi:putative aminopeptidase FrvX